MSELTRAFIHTDQAPGRCSLMTTVKGCPSDSEHIISCITEGHTQEAGHSPGATVQRQGIIVQAASSPQLESTICTMQILCTAPSRVPPQTFSFPCCQLMSLLVQPPLNTASLYCYSDYQFLLSFSNSFS